MVSGSVHEVDGGGGSVRHSLYVRVNLEREYVDFGRIPLF